MHTLQEAAAESLETLLKAKPFAHDELVRLVTSTLKQDGAWGTDEEAIRTVVEAVVEKRLNRRNGRFRRK